MSGFLKIWRSPKSDFGLLVEKPDESQDETLTAESVYTEMELASIAGQGFNAVWVHGRLHNLVRNPVFPEFGKNSERHIAALRALVARSAKFGIRVFLYLEPPHSIPVSDTTFWNAHPDTGGQCVEWEGHDGRKYLVRSLCTSLPHVREYIAESFGTLTELLPELGGYVIITASEYPAHCYSCRNCRPGVSPKRRNAVPLFPTDCPRCSLREPAEVVSELIRTIRDGIRSVSKKKVIFWNWSWTMYVDSPCREILDALPSDVGLMADFERGGMRRDGTYINEYSLSYPGPSEQFLETFESARKRGIEMFAKLQIGTTHELGAVRSLPLIGNLFLKADFIRKNGLGGFMGCWNFGNLESANVRAFNYFLEFKGNPSIGEALVSFAEKFFPDCKSIMLAEAWLLFGKAMEKYPFSIPFLYNSAVNLALSLTPPPGPSDGKKFGRAWLPDERGFDLSGSITETFPLEAVIAAFKSISDIWERGLVLMREAMKDSKDEWALRELGNAEICGRVWRSASLVYSLFALKQSWRDSDRTEYGRLLERQKENMRSVLPYLDRDPRQGYHLEGRFHCFSGELVRNRLSESEGMEKS